LALRFGPGLADLREQNHRNSELFRGFCEWGIGQRWAEGEMQKCEVIFSRALSAFVAELLHFFFRIYRIRRSI